MTHHELSYFLTIAQEGSLTSAAEKLYVTQPTLTKYIQKLEKETGLMLFRRTGKKLSLTYAGERYAYYAEQLLRIHRDMELEMDDIRRTDTERLRVGIPPFRCSFLLPAVLPAFKKKHPNVIFELTEDTSSALDQMLLSGAIDLAVYDLFDPNPQLQYTLLEHDCFYAILPAGHPVREKAAVSPDGGPGVITLDMLKDEIFIIQNMKQRSGQFIIRQMKKLDFTPRQILESSNIRAAAMLAINGYGVSFMSGSLLRHFQWAGRCDHYRIGNLDMSLDLVASCRANGYLSSCAADFIELVRKANLLDPGSAILP